MRTNMKVEKIQLNDTLRKSSDMKSEARSITDTVHSAGGVNSVRVDPLENNITVDYNEDQVTLEQIKQKLKESNYIS